MRLGSWQAMETTAIPLSQRANVINCSDTSGMRSMSIQRLREEISFIAE